MRAIDRSKGEEIAVALIRYAAISVVRSRRRTITAMIGGLLAVTCVSGTFMATDSSTRGPPRAVRSEDLAERLNVSTGATVSFRLATFDPANQTDPRVNVTVATVFGGVRSGAGSVSTPVAVVQVEDAAWYEEQLGYGYVGNGLTGEVRIDRAQVLDPYDLEGSLGNVARLDRQISTALGLFGGRITSDNVPNALSSFANALILQRIFYVGLSATVLLLGFYFWSIGRDICSA